MEIWADYSASSDHMARVKTESGARLDDELDKFLWPGEGNNFGSSIESPHKTTECQKDSLSKQAMSVFENIKASHEYHDFNNLSQVCEFVFLGWPLNCGRELCCFLFRCLVFWTAKRSRKVWIFMLRKGLFEQSHWTPGK